MIRVVEDLPRKVGAFWRTACACGAISDHTFYPGDEWACPECIEKREGTMDAIGKKPPVNPRKPPLRPSLTWGPVEHLRWLDGMARSMEKEYRAAETRWQEAVKAREPSEKLVSADLQRQATRSAYLSTLEDFAREARVVLGLEEP